MDGELCSVVPGTSEELGGVSPDRKVEGEDCGERKSAKVALLGDA